MTNLDKEFKKLNKQFVKISNSQKDLFGVEYQESINKLDELAMQMAIISGKIEDAS
jgi:hypothetical protein